MQRKPSLPRPLFVKKSRRGVLLLHAYSGSANDVRMLSRLLEKRDYTVYAPNLSGHGTMEPLDITSQRVATWQEDVAEALIKLRKNCDQIAVFGLSMGGILAMDALEREPDLIGGGIFCSPLFKNDNQVTASFLKYAQQVYQLGELSEEEKKAKLAEVTTRQPSQMSEIEELGSQVANKLGTLAMPIYIAQAGADEMIDPTTAFQTLAALKQTDVSFYWFAKSGHVITVDPVHRQFEKTLLHFIENLPWNEEK